MTAPALAKGLSKFIAERPAIARALAIALTGRRTVVGFTFVVTAIVSVLMLLAPRTYTSSLAFAPSSSSASLGQLATLAAQAGFALPGTGASETPQFYTDLIRTESFMRSLAQKKYRVSTDDSSIVATLTDLYEIDESTEGRSLYTTVRRLREDLVSVRSSRVTGVISVSVTTRWSDVSQAIARDVLAAVDAFNINTRNSRARDERAFLESSITSAQAALRNAERAVERFLVSNRTFRDDPKLQFEYERLQRDLAVRQETFVTLTRALEQARIEEVRNTPSVSVVDPPSVPLRPDPRGLIGKGLFTLVLTFGMSAGFVVIRASLGPFEPVTEEQIASLAAATVADLKKFPVVGTAIASRFSRWMLQA